MSKIDNRRSIELLAPARTADIAIEAIRHGADAVYLGASSHGARAAAGNAVSDIARVVEYAHKFHAKVYVTVNTIIYDKELADVERLVHQLYHAGVDALIVQDMALLRMDIPPIALHASTQCDIRTPEKARFLAEAGFSQLVLARELTLDEMAQIHATVPSTPLESFVHGALCVSYSGDCQAGFATMGRSANRGECPQICRHKFDLTDGNGKVLIEGKYLLSMRDLNRSAHLSAMLEVGISSFKIEGRLKDVAYVKNTVGAYRRMLDQIIDANNDKYRRASIGVSQLSFTPDLSQSFNRGYTDYFTTTSRPDVKMASVNSPKWTGSPVGTVVRASGNRLTIRLESGIHIANGDGLGYFDSKNNFNGFRVNRVEGANTLITAQSIRISPGTKLYRNADRIRTTQLEGATATRKIDISMTLRRTARGIALDIADAYGHSASAAIDCQHQQANTPQEEARRRVLTKTGNTIYNVSNLQDMVGGSFIPKSTLTSLRRDAIAAFERSRESSYRFDYRKQENTTAGLLHENISLSRHDNVANHLAREFYTDHGASTIDPAIETRSMTAADTDRRIMQTRYCLRREFGKCMCTPSGSQWPRDLRLQSGGMTFQLQFDCKNCRMNVILPR